MTQLTKPPDPRTSLQSESRPRLAAEQRLHADAPPQERVPLWALADQVKDVSGEIALAVDMLDSEDPEEAEAALALLDSFVDAEHSAKAVLFDKADSIAHYIVALQRQSEARRAAAKEDYERTLARAQRDENRADRLIHYLQSQLRRIEPSAKRFELPSYDLASRAGSVRTVVEDEALLPEEFLVQPPAPPAPKPRPDLNAIKAAIKAGREVPGARLVEGERTWKVER